MFNPFETQSIEEIIPLEYEDFLDEVAEPDADFLAEVEANLSGSICVKCGEMITELELDLNDSRCPCCDSIFVLHNKFIQEIADSIVEQNEDILI